MLIEHDKHGRTHVQYLTEELINAGWRIVEDKPVITLEETEHEPEIESEPETVKRKYNRRK
ncbi:hypothetical protein V2P20_09065 [Methylobacter sp. Wu1]|uniref:hypothetical protein n=1 Tax=Methylobacter sp. Wu1 TaxID=3119359 RepID=UPI002F940ADF